MRTKMKLRYECTPEAKSWLRYAVEAGAVHTPKKFITQPSAGKFMATIFWDSEGLLLS